MSSTDLDPRGVLERTWHEQIPLAAALDIRIAQYDGPALITRAPLTPNLNLHGTAFAGSLYAVAALTGWGFVWRLGRSRGCEGDIVLTRGEIDYRRPVADEIVCVATAEAAALDDFLAALDAGRTGRCRVDCRIDSGGRPAVRFSGNYHMRPIDCVAAAR